MSCTRWGENMTEMTDRVPLTNISIFDLDRTITRHASWSPFLLYAARKRAPWRLGLVPFVVVAMATYKTGLIDRKRLKSIMQSMMLGRSVARLEIASLVDRFAERCLLVNIYPQAVELIRAEQAAGRRVMIATAANHFYLDAIANRLGIDDVIGTGSVWKSDRLTSRISGENCYGTAKRDMIAVFFAQHGIDRSDSNVRFYSDHISDLPTFEWADQCIAVNPSRKLVWHAMRQGWTILDWRQKARRTVKASLVSRRPGDIPIKPTSRSA